MSQSLTALSLHGSQGGPLAEMAEAAIAAVKRGENAQVVFDLDDTLFLVRPRKRAIFRELAEAHRHDEALASALHRLAGSEIPYDVNEALGTVGIHHPHTVTVLKDGFFERFFNGEYARHDAPNEGAAHYVGWLHQEGVRIVYLSGRPEEMMSQTREILATHGFPVGGNTEILLKPTAQAKMGDAEFKGAVALEIAEAGPIFGMFDNEPANLNAMLPAAPEAWYFLLETDCSPNPPQLAMSVHVMDVFEMVKHLNASLAATPNFGKGGWSLDVQVEGA